MSTYKEIPWMPFRNDLKDFLDLTKDKNYVHAITEVDITKVSDIFKERKKRGIKNNSLTAYVMWCYGQALHKHPEVQAIKSGKKLVLFDDVDIAMMIEKDLPNGKKWYAYQVKSYTTTDMTPEQIFTLGESEVRRIRVEMEKVIKETGFKGDFSGFSEFLRTDPRFYFTKAEDLLEAYRDICKRADPELIDRKSTRLNSSH